MSDPGVLAARRNEAAMNRAMAGPNANQMIGQRFATSAEANAAEQRAFDACMARMGF